MAAFFLLPTRGWELLIGAFAAIYLVQPNRTENPKPLYEAAGWLGVVLILYATFSFDKSTPWPGIYALAPTLGTLLIILFATKGTTTARIIGNKYLVGIGLVSYSAYLWHQPVLAFARYSVPDLETPGQCFLVFGVFILSFLSWKYVELPFRSKEAIGGKPVFVLAFLLSGIAIILGVISSSLDFRQEEAMARELTQSPAVFASNMNERTFVKMRIKYESENPEAIVIGSSRAMQIGDKVARRDVLNLSVPGASIEDIAAIWWMASEKFNPSVLLIGLDPWIFNRNSGQLRWISLAPEYSSAMAALGIKISIEHPEKESKPPLSESLVSLYNSINTSTFKSPDDKPSVIDKIRHDGSRVYNIAFSQRTLEEVERSLTAASSYAMTNFDFSDETKHTLETLTRKLSAAHNVTFVLSPYHPVVYESISASGIEIGNIEEVIRQVAVSNGALVIGSYDPSKVNCSAGEFYDGLHPKASCMTKVFRN